MPLKYTAVDDLADLKIPDKVHQALLHDPQAQLLLIRYNNNQMLYIYHSDNFGRAQVVLDAFKKVAVWSHDKVPTGDYLFVLNDGVNDDFGWPVFAFAAPQQLVAAHKAVLIPDYEALTSMYAGAFKSIDKTMAIYSWDKKTNKIFWRGSLSGSTHLNNDLLGSDRLRMLYATKDLQFVDIALTDYSAQHNDVFLQRVKKLYPLKEKVSPGHSIAYKYLLDVDGNSCSYSRMAWILYSNSVLFKHQSEKEQWYYAMLKPYIHYVPIKNDFSDISKQYLWAEQNQQQMQMIAERSHELALQIFNPRAVYQSFGQALIAYHGYLVDTPWMG